MVKFTYVFSKKICILRTHRYTSNQSSNGVPISTFLAVKLTIPVQLPGVIIPLYVELDSILP